MSEDNKNKEPKISNTTSEQIVLNKFANWQKDEYAQKTLMKMGYDLNRIKSVIAYIEEDEAGNRTVKLKVNLKSVSSQSVFKSGMSNDIKNTIETNDTIQKLITKFKEIKEKYLGQHKQ